MEIGTVDFVIDAERLGESRLSAYATSLFDRWDSEVAESLRLDDYGLLLEVEDGSIKGKGRIVTVASALFVAISGYGSFSGGLRQIAADIRDVGSFLVNQAEKQAAGLGGRVVDSRKDAGKFGRLYRLFRDVQSGRLSPEDATQQATQLFEGEDVSEEQLRRVQDALHHLPRFGPQLEFPEDLIGEGPRRRRPLRNDRPKPAPTETDGLRVQVWKDTRYDPRHVRVERTRKRR